MPNQTVIYLSDPDLKPWLKKQSEDQGISLSRLITNYLSAMKKQQTPKKQNPFLKLAEIFTQ
jgi:hypothetical protein